MSLRFPLITDVLWTPRDGLSMHIETSVLPRPKSGLWRQTKKVVYGYVADLP